MQPMKPLFPLVASTALMLACASIALGQSLGEVARQEEARRKKLTKQGKIYTNETLRGETPSPPSPAGPPAASAGTPAAEQPAAADASEARKKDEAYWRGRISAAREGLERSKTFQEALQSRINALTADFAARDDPAQRNVVGANRQKALAELDRVTKDIANYEKQIRDIEEEARRAGVPPGWLR